MQETGKNCVVDTKRAEDTVKKHLRQVVETGVENRTGKGRGTAIINQFPTEENCVDS